MQHHTLAVLTSAQHETGLPQLCLVHVHLQVKEYKADLASLREQLKQAATGASEGDAARAELGLGDNYYSTSGGCGAAAAFEARVVFQYAAQLGAQQAALPLC